MDQFDDLIKNSVEQHFNKENKVELDEDLKIKSNDEVVQRKRKKDDESTDEEEMPRKRVVFMGQLKKNRRAVSKYQRELNKEIEQEKFFAQV